MTQRRLHWTRLAIAAMATAGLAGCFGGGDSDSSVPADPLAAVPDSATQSVSGLVAYLLVLAANLNDAREPMDITGVTLATSDTTEPETLN